MDIKKLNNSGPTRPAASKNSGPGGQNVGLRPAGPLCLKPGHNCTKLPILAFFFIPVTACAFSLSFFFCCSFIHVFTFLSIQTDGDRKI